MHCSSLFGTPCNLVYNPDDDNDSGRSMSVINNV